MAWHLFGVCEIKEALMSMTDTDLDTRGTDAPMVEPTAPPPKPKRKYRRRQRAYAPRPSRRKVNPDVISAPAAAALRLVESNPAGLTEATFAGISATDCCNDCNESMCVITQIGFCGHPLKGELQSALQNKPAIVQRRKFAKLMLDRMKLEAKDR